MKIELERGKGYRRVAVEIHPWVEKSIAAALYTAIAGGSAVALVGGLVKLLGH